MPWEELRGLRSPPVHCWRATRGIHVSHPVTVGGDDWVCVPCIGHGQQKVRMWVGKTECRFCHTAREDMFGVTRVRDYPQGTVFM